MAGRPALRALSALAAAAAMVAASCGGGGGGGGSAGTPAAATVRIDLAPDPIWEWIQGSGLLSRWQQEHEVRIEVTNSFDQFLAFASGHADIVVINALDVANFVEQAGREPVIIGKLTTDRSILAVSRTLRTAATLEDLVDRRIAVESSLGSTLLWGLIADALYDLDFRVDGADFDLVVVDPASLADLVERGDVDACICLPDFSVSSLADGRLRPLHDGRPAAQIYATEVLQDPADLPMEMAMIVDAHWLDSNRDAVEHVFELWDRGFEGWHSNKAKIVSDYRHLFSVRTDDEVEWITRYADDHNWRTPSARLEERDVGIHAEIYFRMERAGLIAQDAFVPEIQILGAHTHGDEAENEHDDEHDDEHEEEPAAQAHGTEEQAV